MNQVKRKSRAKAKAKINRARRGRKWGVMRELRALARESIRRATIIEPEKSDEISN